MLCMSARQHFLYNSHAFTSTINSMSNTILLATPSAVQNNEEFKKIIYDATNCKENRNSRYLYRVQKENKMYSTTQTYITGLSYVIVKASFFFCLYKYVYNSYDLA